MDTIFTTLIFLPAILIALTFHEFSHAWVAYKLGDYTGKAEGRLSLNPLVHLDPIGTITLILFRFGWAKPVPIAEYNFKNPVKGTMLTALAGPLSNLILATMAAISFRIFEPTNQLLVTFIIYFVFINIALMVFNLLPVPPLDGHKIVRGLLPTSLRYYWEDLERYSMYIFIPTVIFIIYTGALFIVVNFLVGLLLPIL